jgi:hypothetical protein
MKHRRKAPYCRTCRNDGVLMRWRDSTGLVTVERLTRAVLVPAGVKAGGVDCPDCAGKPQHVKSGKSSYPD